MNKPQPKPGNPPQDDDESLEDYADRCKNVRFLPPIIEKLPGSRWMWTAAIIFGIPLSLVVSQVMWTINLLIFDWYTRP